MVYTEPTLKGRTELFLTHKGYIAKRIFKREINLFNDHTWSVLNWQE